METYVAKFRGGGTSCQISDNNGEIVAIFKRKPAALVLNRVLRIFGRLPNTSRITYLDSRLAKQPATYLKQQASGPFSRFRLFSAGQLAGDIRQIPESLTFHLEVSWLQRRLTVTCDQDAAEFTVKEDRKQVASFVVLSGSWEPVYTLFCFEAELLPAILSILVACQMILYG